MGGGIIIAHIIYANSRDPYVTLGHQGDAGVTTVCFDLSDWQNHLGPGTAALTVLRRGDREPYPAVIRQEGCYGLWQVSRADAAKEGYGQVQLSYLVGEKIIRSRIYETRVLPSLEEPGQAPEEPEKGFLEQVQRAAERAEQSSAHGPRLKGNQWQLWDAAAGAYADTGVSATQSGPRGPVFTPSSEETEGGHRITWANDGALPNPEPVLVRDGRTPVRGRDYDTPQDRREIRDAVLETILDPMETAIAPRVEGTLLSARSSRENALLELTVSGETELQGEPAPDRPAPQEHRAFRSLTLTGKNLLDYRRAAPRNESQTVEIQDQAVVFTGNYYFVLPMELPQGARVYFSVEGEWEYAAVEYTDSTINALFFPDSPRAATLEKDSRALLLYKKRPDVTESVTFRHLQMELGEVPTAYEPPVVKTITLPEPLVLPRWDRLLYRDHRWQLERGGSSLTLTGGPEEQWEAVGGGCFRLETEGLAPGAASEISLCSRFRPVPYERMNSGETGIYAADGTGKLVFRGGGAETTVTGWRAFLGDCPTELRLRRSSPRMEALPEETVRLLKEIGTRYPNTVVRSTVPLELRYLADTKTYIDDRLEELRRAVLPG